VTFDIDANGILSVTAKDKATNKMQSITISGASTLPKDEVERMVKDAEANAAVDKEKIEQIDLKNQSETICYQAKKLLENNDTPEAEKAKIQGIVSELETAIAKEDYAAMKDLMAQYTSMQTAAASSANAATDSGNDDVIDTDFSAEK
jgi:molecular chaperone DnaK